MIAASRSLILTPSATVLTRLPGDHLYDLPPELLAKGVWGGRYRGQTQAWYALRFTGDDSEVDITAASGPAPEFDAWRWAKTSELAGLIVPFKRDVYRAVLADAATLGIV